MNGLFKKMKFFSFICIFLLAQFQLFACSEVTIANDKVVVSARTTDFEAQVPSNIVLNPRGLSLSSSPDPNNPSYPPLQWVSQYGSVVVSPSIEQLFAVVDGMNEKGLTAASLWFEGATYPTPTAGAPVLGVSYLARYILDNFATVTEAVSGIQTLNIFGDQFDYFGTIPFHITIHDATGDSALIEFLSTSGPTIIHPIAPYNVVTNEPSYATMVANAQTYGYFQNPRTATPTLPGDLDSESRFVRLAAFFLTTPTVDNAPQALAYVFSLISTVVEPFGGLHSDTLLSPDPYSLASPTWWTTLRDNINLHVYYRPFESETFYVNMQKINFSSNKIKHRKMDLFQKGLVGDITPLLLLGSSF